MTVRKLICRVKKLTNVREFSLFFSRRPAQPAMDEITITLTPKQRQIIERRYRDEVDKLAGRERIGHATLNISPKKKKVKWVTFYPFGSKPSEMLLRKGIGSRVHSAIIESIAAEFPEHKIAHNIQIENARVDQLRSMGIDPYYAHTMKAYLTKVRQYMTEQKKKGK